jgi:acyl-coenzyme A thioesterase PaaI-like protein
METDATVLTVEFKLNLLAPGNGALLIARGHVIKTGRTLTVCQSDVSVMRNGEEKLCAVALITLIQLAGRPDNPPSP